MSRRVPQTPAADGAHPFARGMTGAPHTITLSADQVNVTFHGVHDSSDVVALNDVSLSIQRGQFVALVGPSGCGKTTVLNLFAGLLRPTRGTVRVNATDPTATRPEVGYMFARDALLPWRSTSSNVALGLEAKRVPRARRRERAQELLDLVGLGQFTDKYPRQLSQGMRQRAAIARTLAPDPAILLMDEPFAALDAQTKLRLQAEFLRIWESEDTGAHKTVLFVTHDLQEALLLADRVVVMLPRPGHVADDQLIRLPRPRTQHLAEILFSKDFRQLHESLFHLLQGDVPLGEAPSSDRTPEG